MPFDVTIILWWPRYVGQYLYFKKIQDNYVWLFIAIIVVSLVKYIRGRKINNSVN